MTMIESLVQDVTDAPSWDSRVALIRRIPEEFGRASHRAVYAQVAQAVYVPYLQPSFGYVHWREDYELDTMVSAYEALHESTSAFADVDANSLSDALFERPQALLALRNIVGYTQGELAEATALLPNELDLPKTSKTRIASMERGRPQPRVHTDAIAETIARLMDGRLFPSDPRSPMRRKQAKPDTADGWASVRRASAEGVPYSWLLHQRHYGGSFRQLLDATSGRRGDALEEPVEQLLGGAGIPYVRTGSHNQEEIASRFGLTIRPAPDFVMFDGSETIRALLECKAANDGGTARDKAGRFRTIRTEAARHGGVPVFAFLAGLGWQRVGDALGPVVEACEGRVFTPVTLDEMLDVSPLRSLSGTLSLSERVDR